MAGRSANAQNQKLRHSFFHNKKKGIVHQGWFSGDYKVALARVVEFPDGTGAIEIDVASAEIGGEGSGEYGNWLPVAYCVGNGAGDTGIEVSYNDTMTYPLNN